MTEKWQLFFGWKTSEQSIFHTEVQIISCSLQQVKIKKLNGMQVLYFTKLRYESIELQSWMPDAVLWARYRSRITL